MERAEPIRVLLCDDVPEFRALMRIALEDPQFDVVGEAGDGLEAVAAVRETSPDVLVLDLSMPGIDVLEVIPRVRALGTGTRIVVLSGFEAVRLRGQVVQAGASGFVQKGSSFKVIRDAVREAGAESPRH